MAGVRKGLKKRRSVGTKEERYGRDLTAADGDPADSCWFGQERKAGLAEAWRSELCSLFSPDGQAPLIPHLPLIVVRFFVG